MKIAIIGYGKMGHMIEDVAQSRGHQIVGVIDPRLNEELKIKNEELSLPLIDFESEEFRSADVAIEFTTPATAKDNILRAWAQGVPVVCGTTGWKPEELKGEGFELKEVDSKKLIVESKTGKVMLVWSSNYSVGVNIFFELNKFLAEQMKNLTPSCSTDGHRQSDRAELFTRSGGGRKPPGPRKGEEREEGEMPTGSRRNTKNLTAAKMPPKETKRMAERTAEPCPNSIWTQ